MLYEECRCFRSLHFSPPGSEVRPVSSASAFLFLSVLAWMHAMRGVVRAESVHSFPFYPLVVCVGFLSPLLFAGGGGGLARPF